MFKFTKLLWDDGKRLGLHPRGQVWQREDGGTTGDRGRRETADDGRQRMTGDSGRQETADDGRQRTTGDSGRQETADDGRQHPSYAGCNTGESGTRRERE